MAAIPCWSAARVHPPAACCTLRRVMALMALTSRFSSMLIRRAGLAARCAPSCCDAAAVQHQPDASTASPQPRHNAQLSMHNLDTHAPAPCSRQVPLRGFASLPQLRQVRAYARLGQTRASTMSAVRLSNVPCMLGMPQRRAIQHAYAPRTTAMQTHSMPPTQRPAPHARPFRGCTTPSPKHDI